MEKIFLSTFFDVIIHLTLYLPREVELANLVQNRSIYPFEREFERYKKWTYNKTRPWGVHC